MSVTYTSRLPLIAAEIPHRVSVGTKVGAELVMGLAKGKVPVGVRTPHLRDRIHVEFKGSGDWAVVAGDSEVWWGNFVENGTVRAPAHPFLVPALEEGRIGVEQAVTIALRTLA